MMANIERRTGFSKAFLGDGRHLGDALVDLCEEVELKYGGGYIAKIDEVGWEGADIDDISEQQVAPTRRSLESFLQRKEVTERGEDRNVTALWAFLAECEEGKDDVQGDEVEDAVETGEQPESTAVPADEPVEAGPESTEADDEVEGPFAALRDGLGRVPGLSQSEASGSSGGEEEVADQSADDDDKVADQPDVNTETQAAVATEETKEEPAMAKTKSQRGAAVMYQFVREGLTYEVNLKGPGVRTYFGMRVESLRKAADKVPSQKTLAELFDKTGPFFPNMANKDSGDLQPYVVEGVAKYLEREPWEFLVDAPGVKHIGQADTAEESKASAPSTKPEAAPKTPVEPVTAPAKPDTTETADAPADEPSDNLRDAISSDGIVSDDADQGAGDEVVGDGLDSPSDDHVEKLMEELIALVNWPDLFFRANDAGLIPEERFRTVTEDYISRGLDVDFAAEFMRAFETFENVIDNFEGDDFELVMRSDVQQFMKSVSMFDMSVIVLLLELEEEQSDFDDVQVEDPS